MRSLASIAAVRLGANSGASTLRAVVGSSFSLSQVNSNWYRCCIGRSTPIFHFPRFFCSLFIITTSPTLMSACLPPCFKRCRSRNPLRYSLVQRFHTASLHRPRYFARFLISPSSMWYGSNSGSRFGCSKRNVFGIRTGNWMSSSR